MGTGLIGLIGGVIIGRNWNRLKKSVSWLGDRIKEEVEAIALGQPEGIAEYDHSGQLICEYIFVGGRHVRLDRYGKMIPDAFPNNLL